MNITTYIYIYISQSLPHVLAFCMDLHHSCRYSTPEMQKTLQVDRLSKLNLKNSSANTSYSSS